MKFLKWTLTIILVVLLGVITVSFLYLQSSRPVYHGEIHVRGISDDITVRFDNHGIPHIAASNEKDAFFTLGYLQAQERLFQMELLRRVGAGRLAEIFGPDLVRVDAFFRTLGLNKSAREASAMFFSKPGDPWQENTLAFIRGINAFMFQGPTPPEFLILGIPKVKYTPEDIYLITGYMAFSFAEALRTDPILDKIARKLGPDYLKALNWEGNPPAAIDSTARSFTQLSVLADEVMQMLPVTPWIGSNSFALAPSRSASGKVLFENDTHIGYQQPAVWYEAHMSYPGFEIYGNYLAGMPFPLIGHNRSVTWGLTMFENDDMNLYREKGDPSNASRYNYKGVWENYRVREETISVKSKKDTTIVVRESIHGPLVNDVVSQLDSTETEPIALWWTYTRFPATALQVTYELAHAKNINQARTAASMVNAPGLNIVYGDVDGNIAMWSAAKLPMYPTGINTKIILDGSSSDFDIKGYYDFDKNPKVENPEEGIICSANQKPAPVDSISYPGYYAPNDRVNRLRELLNSQETWTLAQLENVNTDVLSKVQPVNARIILEVLDGDSSLTKSELHKTAAAYLKNWKGTHNLKDVSPTIYYRLLANILQMTMKDELGAEDYGILVNSHLMKNSYTTFLSNDSSAWWDNISTPDKHETRKEIFSAAYMKTIDDLQLSSGEITNWTWGGFHTLEHVHPLGRKSPLDKIFNVGPFQVPGGIETVNNAAFPLTTEGKFKVSYGPAMRILIDMNDLDHGKSVLPTGQSGHVRSPYYQDQAPLYVNGRFRPMMMNQQEIISKCTNVLTFKPE